MSSVVTEVGQLIDAPISQFISYVNELSYAGCNMTKKLLEAELYRTGLTRGKILGEMEQGIDRVKDYVTTFVVEQKILDRVELVESFRLAKGIDLSIFSQTEVVQ